MQPSQGKDLSVQGLCVAFSVGADQSQESTVLPGAEHAAAPVHAHDLAESGLGDIQAS